MADPVPYGMDGPAEDQMSISPQTAPLLGSLAMGVLNIPKHLIDSAAQFNPNDIHGNSAAMVPAAADTAMGLAGLGAPAAEAGAAGIFGGKLAQTADIKALIEANKMREGGKGAEQVWNDTGWFRSPTDNKWKFEIPDDHARMMGHGLDYANEGSSITGPTQFMMQHDDLYKAYPQLADRRLQNSVLHNPSNGVGTGGHYPDTGFIEVNAPDLRRAKSIGIHELQHGVQGIENFARGGSPDMIAALQESSPSKLPLPAQKMDPYDAYRNLAGEVEARNVQSRSATRDLVKAQYPDFAGKPILQPPWETHDTPYNQQLIKSPMSDLIRMLRSK